jgi:hypothetical protein
MTPGPDSLRLGFLGHRSFTPAAPCWQAAVALASRPIRRNTGSRKPSVPGRVHSIPESCGSPGSDCAPKVQPVSDSRHGRIACKVSLSPFCKEQRAPASNQTIGLGCPTPSLVSGGSQNQCVVILDKLRRAAASNQALGIKRPTLSLVSGGSHKFHFLFNASSGNIRMAS